MKIVAQSLVPTRPTYIHIAYLAAKTDTNLSPGVWTIVACIFIMLIQAQRRMRLLTFVPTLLLALSAYWVFFVVKPLKPIYAYPEGMSRSRARDIFYKIYTERINPSSIEDITKKMGPDKTKDAWNQDFSLRKSKDGYQVISAGEDGKFGTKDDVKWPSDDILHETNEDIKNSLNEK